MSEASPRQVAAAIRGAAVSAGQTAPSVRGADWQVGVVTAVGVGTVDVGNIRARRIDDAYPNPAVGDKVMLSQNSSGNWVALGETASAIRALGAPLPPRYKAAATDRASTTTLADDPDLTMQLDAGSTYLIEFHLFVGGATTGLVKTAWTVPADATGLKGVQGPASTVAGDSSPQSSADGITMRAGSHGFGTAVVYGRRNVYTNLVYAVETGTVSTVTGGTCALSWAQNASNSTPARVGLGSWMRATRIM
ncbi:hypothetical protein [Streptomyces axinellae]|uniref:Minor tail protein n=1 Tax=Streptomyces axinellae TaxID=552788 RepID=A0ABN3QLD0_9ACTN